MRINIVLLSVLVFLFLLPVAGVIAQSNNALSIYEGERIQSVEFRFAGLPAGTPETAEMEQQVKHTFQVPLYSHFNEFQLNYYLSRIHGENGRCIYRYHWRNRRTVGAGF